MKLFQLLPKKLYDFACNLPSMLPPGNGNGTPPRGDGWKRRAMGVVSGGAAERPMEPEAVRVYPCVFAIPTSPGHYWGVLYAQGRASFRYAILTA